MANTQTTKSHFTFFLILIAFSGFASCKGEPGTNNSLSLAQKIESWIDNKSTDAYQPAQALLVLPAIPVPHEPFRVIATGGQNIGKATIIVQSPSGPLHSLKYKNGSELPFWRIGEFTAVNEGNYQASLIIDRKVVTTINFTVASHPTRSAETIVWNTRTNWNSSYETLYSAWINALFQGSDEQTSWSSLHEITQNRERNFLFDYLSLGEDNHESTNKVIMEPDCADNPFFLRAYFSWKLGLPFGYHLCDRGYQGKNPQTGQWITNETTTSKKHPVLAFNAFLRQIMNGVHSGTGRTALENESADYYPVELTKSGLRPGTVFADPYGHTFVLVSWVSQTKNKPGVLLAVDAQPDKTVAIKRFWKGNFLFNTQEVIGEPGFKAFRPIRIENGKPILLKNEALNLQAGFAPFSLMQHNMPAEEFYHTLEQLINPRPLDPEEALHDLIKALHEQLLVRVKSVSNGTDYLKKHPGLIVPMPSNANGIFLTGGDWENFSTPNRDLRLLIAMDAVLDFPEKVSRYPDDFKTEGTSQTEKISENLKQVLEQETNDLSISYIRSDGSEQILSLKEILQRRAAFEMAYNPNDGPEVRWGAPVDSQERSTCTRFAPANQQKTMQNARKWFSQRLHPPT